MRILLIASVFGALAVPAKAQGPDSKNSTAPVQARNCPRLAEAPRPGRPVKALPLSRLPPAEIYAAVYYLNGCPRRLVQAQGKGRR